METVFAIGILLLGLGAAVTLVATSVMSSQKNEETIVITNLAREALELVRSIRDGSQTSQGFASLTEGVWVVDVDTSTFDQSSSTLIPASLASPQPPALVSDCTNCDLVMLGGRYVAAIANPGGSPTQYTRMVEIIDTPVVSPETVYQKRVIASVLWKERGRNHIFTLETELWDWK